MVDFPGALQFRVVHESGLATHYSKSPPSLFGHASCRPCPGPLARCVQHRAAAVGPFLCIILPAVLQGAVAPGAPRCDTTRSVPVQGVAAAAAFGHAAAAGGEPWQDGPAVAAGHVQEKIQRARRQDVAKGEAEAKPGRSSFQQQW